MKTYYRLTLFLLLTLLLTFYSYTQTADDSIYRVVFYNVENLFDPREDSLKNDEAFTPTGLNHWTFKKLHRKVNNIAKVLIALGEEKPPDIIGLAEVENFFVLRQLCYNSPLAKYHYKIVHYDSPDARGIDVALLYCPDRVQVVHSEALTIEFPFEKNSKNRDILYVVATISQTDSLHLFVNHWTSRYSGYAATIPKRNYYASVVRKKVDSLLLQNENANILIMGDFNDYPTDESMLEVLRAKDFEKESGELYNLMFRFLKMANIGTHKREDFWGCLDQMIVSEALLRGKNHLYVRNRRANIFKADFMVVPDEKYGGDKVFRTYSGPKYIGGYSDHLPVFLDLFRLNVNRNFSFDE